MCLAQGPQHSDAGEARTRSPSVSSQAPYHWATVLPNLSVKQGQVVLGWTSTKLKKCIWLKDHNTMTPLRLEPAAPRSPVKHSTTEPLRPLDS